MSYEPALPRRTEERIQELGLPDVIELRLYEEMYECLTGGTWSAAERIRVLEIHATDPQTNVSYAFFVRLGAKVYRDHLLIFLADVDMLTDG